MERKCVGHYSLFQYVHTILLVVLLIRSVDTLGTNDLYQHWQAVLLSTLGEYVLIWTSPPTDVHVHCAHCVGDSTCAHGSTDIHACAEAIVLPILFMYQLLLRM